MIIPFIAGQFIAHFLADFLFQTEKMCLGKSQRSFRSPSLFFHVLIVFILSWGFSLSFYFGFYALIIAVTHYLIDGLKVQAGTKWPSCIPFTFVVDQALHLLIIVLVAGCYFWRMGIGFPFGMLDHAFPVLLGYILCTKPANVLLKNLLDGFHIHTQPTEQELLNAGKLIGIFERLMVITFVLVDQFSAIGFLIAAKSIIRYKDSEKPKTEYVLIGTLYSFGFAILIGVIVKYMIN